jgi:hypothetical protein
MWNVTVHLQDVSRSQHASIISSAQRWFHSGTHSDASRQHSERGAPPKEPFLSHTTLTRVSFARGCRVRVTGLAAAAAQHHNGKAATVCADFDKSTGQFIVLLDDCVLSAHRQANQHATRRCILSHRSAGRLRPSGSSTAVTPPHCAGQGTGWVQQGIKV